MKRLLYPLLTIALLLQLRTFAQAQYPVPLAAAIANRTSFQVQLNPGESNGTLIGGETYVGHYNPDSNTFMVSGLGLREDGVVIPLTATYGGADPMRQELSLWGALYTFDSRGNLFLGIASSGRLAGRIGLRK